MTTTITSMLRLPSFEASALEVLKFVPAQQEALRASLGPGSNVPVPDGVDRGDWKRALGTFHFMYEVASREGVEAVVSDLLASERVADAVATQNVDRDVLVSLLAADSAADIRIRGERRRDRFLPVLSGSRVAVDLRVLEGDDEEPADGADIEVAPVITLRLEFDEDIAGQDGIVVQVPYGVLREVLSDLQTAETRVRRIVENLSALRVPAWAQPESEE